jgi:hypothetical protein
LLTLVAITLKDPFAVVNERNGDVTPTISNAIV